MLPTLVVFLYLAGVLYLGVFAFRRQGTSRDDYFVAGRSLGGFVFLFSLFGTNMTAFAILGSSGLAYRRGVGVYGLMAAASCFVIPLTLLLIGTRLWAYGKRFGHLTQVQFFRDRWECSAIGTVIFAVTALMLVPYIVIGVMGGGATLEALSTVGGAAPLVSYEAGGALVALVVMSYVFFGGMRGTAWVNTAQTLMFLTFGGLAFVLIGQRLGGFDGVMGRLAQDPATATLLSRARIPDREFLSYFFIPLSSIMFPHISIMCLTARRLDAFKRTIVLYPLCIMAIWLPSVYLGVVAADRFPGLGPGQSDNVLLRLLTELTDPLLAGVLGAAILACVMAADSQILALSTMFSQDVFAFHGGRARFGDRAQVWAGRSFVVVATLAAYAAAIAARDRIGIFEVAIRFAFSGYASLAPVMLAALFWRRSTRWGALAATLWVALAMAGTWWLHAVSEGIAPPPGKPPVPIFPALGDLFQRTAAGVTVHGFLPVLPMLIGSALLVVVASLATAPPGAATLARYFPPSAR